MKLDIIVPVFNEVENIEPLVERISAAMNTAEIDYSLIIVDDNSTDGTFRKLQKLSKSKKFNLTPVLKQGKKGKAYSILEGAALGTSEFVAMLDGDLEYPPELLPELLTIAQENGLSVGNRKKTHNSSLRRLASKGFRFVFGKVLLGLNVDVQSGMKVFRREILDHIDADSVTPWTLDVTLLHTAQELGFSVGSTEIDFSDRVSGESKVKVMKAAFEIGSQALKHKLRGRTPLKIAPTDGMQGAGLAHKRKRFITHTTLSHNASAVVTFTTGQKIFFFSVVALFIFGLILNPAAAAITFVALLSLIYFLDVLFSSFVLIKSLHFPPEISISENQLSALDTDDLPVYSVLCPLYKEAHILPQFVDAMSELTWPKEKLEVLLLLEEDDKATIKAAEELDLPSYFKVVVVPDSNPKTKPKACNYGLSVAKGEYIVIYDAEDKPDPDQLQKVYLSFQQLGETYGCVQCKLNYFNPTHNLLTRLFTAEYSLWFDVVLPGLQSIEGTIPLGGTSNHFRRADLLEFEAWDPFNVTEDCDLGVRLFKAGRKTAIVDSTTLEEANSNVRNWIRQRSRWIKGYFQTYLVHMRNPLQFFWQHRLHALIFQLVIGMRMTFMLINPFLWLVTIAYFAAYKYVGPAIESLFPSTVFYMAAFALVVGNFMYIYNYMIGLAKRGHWGLIKFVFFIPVYWLLTSIAAAMALWQLITKPHYWEKTNHGLHLPLSKIKREEPEEAIIETPDSVVLPTPIVTKKEGLLRGSVVLIAATLFASVLNFVYSAYLGASTSFSDFGLLSLLAGIINVAQIPFSTYARAVTHNSAMLYGKYGIPVKAFWMKLRGGALIPSLVLTFLWIVSIPFLASFFNTQDILPFLLISPVWTIGIAAAIDSGFLSGSHKFVIAAIMTVTEAIVRLGSTVLFIQSGQTHLVYTAIPLSLISSFVVGWVAVLFLKNVRPAEMLEREISTVSKRFLGSSFLVKLSSIAFLSIDVLLAKHYLSAEDAGRYALISLIGKMVYFLGSIFSQFVNPLVSKNMGARVSSKRVFQICIGLSALSCIGGFIVFGVLGPVTLPLLLGPKVQEVFGHLAIYTFAFGAVATASGIIAYHQSKGKHLFSFISLFGALYMIALVGFFHGSLDAIVMAVSVGGITYFALTILFHWLVGDPELSKATPSRILIFNWRDTKHTWAGGAEVYVQEIAKSWVRQGKIVTIFCGNDGKCPRYETVDGVHIIRRGGHYTVYFWAFVYYIFSLGNTCDAIVESENGMPFFTKLYSNKPIFLLAYHVHQKVFRENLSFPLAQIAMAIEKYFMPLVYRNGQIITISNSTKEDLTRLGFTEPSDIEIVTPGVEMTHYSERKKTDHPSFVYVGRLKKYKNVDTAIHAFAKLLFKYPKAKLTIAGAGEMKQELMREVEALGIEKSVHFAGRVSEAEKAALLAESWVALQPSSIEGWGITVIEANAAGTPVIASRVPGLQDSVVDAVTGTLVNVRDIHAWEEAMQEMIENEEQRLHLSKAAKKWSEKFSWEQSGSRFLKTIETQF